MRVLSEEVFHPITPNDLLLGRAARRRETWEAELHDQAVDPRCVLSAEEELCERWWTEWVKTAFPLLVPRGKWSTQHRNLCVGDVVLLKYDAKFSKDRYRLAKVTKVHPDKGGVVRTVTVGMRPRHVREPSLPYKAKPLSEFAVGVQRLVVILPKEEQEMNEALEETTDAGEDDDKIVRAGIPTQVRSEESKKKRPERRSRRLRKLEPEVFLTATSQGIAPRPVLEPQANIPTSLVCLFRGAPPLRVPTWMLDMMEDEEMKSEF